MRGLALGVLAALMVGGFAQAATSSDVEKRYTPALQHCMDTPEGMSTNGQIQCIAVELTIQDKRLNAAYGKAMSGLTPGQKGKLRAAQRAWVAFRDTDCKSLYDEEWGTLSRIFANDCVLRRTVERTIELEDFPPGQ